MLLGMWELSSLTRVQLSPPALKTVWNLNNWTTRKVPNHYLIWFSHNDPFGMHRVRVSKYPYFTDKGWNRFALCYQPVPLRCAKARRFFFFFSAFSNCSRSGGARRTEAERVEVRLLVRSAIRWSWPHHLQAAAVTWGWPKRAGCSEGSHPRTAFCCRFVGKWLGDG